MRTIRAISASVLLVIGLGFAGEADFADAKASEAAYCERVIDGTHSDYLQLGGVCHDRD